MPVTLGSKAPCDSGATAAAQAACWARADTCISGLVGAHQALCLSGDSSDEYSTPPPRSPTGTQHPGPGGDLPSNGPHICFLPPVSLSSVCCCSSPLSCLHASPALRVYAGKCQMQQCPLADEETEAHTGEIMSPSRLLSKWQSQNGSSAVESDFIMSPETWKGRYAKA